MARTASAPPAAPTATQFFGDVQETPNRYAWAVPFGQATLSAVHDFPFHTRVDPTQLSLAELAMRPAATQLLAETHDTSLSENPLTSADAAVFIGVKALPFHRSSSVLKLFPIG